MYRLSYEARRAILVQKKNTAIHGQKKSSKRARERKKERKKWRINSNNFSGPKTNYFVQFDLFFV